MARSWLSIQVELVSGLGRRLWPRPGRIFVAARTHTFWDLAEAINLGFGRWDQSHLSEFVLEDGSLLALLDPWLDPPEDAIEIRRVKLSRLSSGERFAFIFDLGDRWTHLCTVGRQRVDPEDQLGVVPELPTAYFGWGELPDQYDRSWRDDDGEQPVPSDPQGADLPPLLPEWRR